jgi:transglutaminase-like putative cysteine protease
LKITPENHTINWRRDVSSNWIAKLNFPEKTNVFKIEVDLVADLKTINPFDFLIDPYAAEYPFTYTEELTQELQAYLPIQEQGSLLKEWISQDIFRKLIHRFAMDDQFD